MRGDPLNEHLLEADLERHGADCRVYCDCGELHEDERLGACEWCGATVCPDCRFDMLDDEYLCPICTEMLKLEIATVVEQES